MSESNAKRVEVNLPQHMEDGGQETFDRSEFVSHVTKMYLRERKKSQIRETMQQGYMEMAKINLNIAAESFLAEEEAENTLDRLVSGV